MPETEYLQFKPYVAPVGGVMPESGSGAGTGGDLEFKPYEAPAGGVQLRPAETAPGRPTNTPEQINIDFQNQLRAMQQHTSPIISAHQRNFLSDRVEQDDAGRWVYIDQRGNFVPLDSGQHVLLQDPADAKFKVFARSPDTTEGTLAGLGRLVMAGSGAGALAVPARVAPAVAAAERLGIEVPRAIATESPVVRMAGQVVAKTPMGGPMTRAVESGLEHLGGAAERAAELTGGASDAAIAGGSVRTGFAEAFKPAVRSTLENLYNRVDQFIDPAVRTSLDKTRGVVEDLAARRAAYGEETMGRAADMVRNAAQRPEGLTYAAIKDLRSRIGEMVDTGLFPEGTSERELRSIYGALSDDLRTAVRTAGGEEALAAFEKANQAKAYTARWTEKLEKVLGPKTRSDEGVASALFRMAQSGAGADLQTLKAARDAVPRSAWQDVAANAISRLGRDRAGQFAPAAFVRDYANLSEAGKRILFGDAGAGNLITHLDDIANISNKFLRAGKLGRPATGGAHSLEIGAGILGGHGIAAGSLLEPLSAIGGAIGVNVLARLLATPATAASMSRWTRAFDAVVNRPGRAALEAFDLATRHLAQTASPYAGRSATNLAQQIKQAAGIADPNQRQQPQLQ